jgi:hypothetical protein
MSYLLNESITDLNLIDKINQSPNINEYAYFDNRIKNKKLYWLINIIDNNKLFRCHYSLKDNIPSDKNIINLGEIKSIKAKIR